VATSKAEDGHGTPRLRRRGVLARVPAQPKKPGLAGWLIISDQPADLVAALRRTFRKADTNAAGSTTANYSPLVSKSHKDRVAAARSPPSSPAWPGEAYDEVLLRTHYVVSRW
jgi:hypothetical protein